MTTAMATAVRRRGRHQQRHLQRGVPLLVGLVALALVIGVFPTALPTDVTGPGSQAGGAAHAGLNPFGLGRRGVGGVGLGIGSGQSGALGAGASQAQGAGPGPGRGSGPGPGSGQAGSPVPMPPLGPTPGSPTCPSGTVCPPSPLLGIRCHDGVPGDPNSHTTEDPLSPPCVAWDGVVGASDPRHGVYQDHIDVVVLFGPGTTNRNDSFSCKGPVQTGVADRAPRVLCQFFQNNFQVYGRNVEIYEYVESDQEVRNAQLLADDLHRGLFHPQGVGNPPFAVIGSGPGAVIQSQYYAKEEIEYFEFKGSYFGNGDANGFDEHFPESFLTTDWRQGGTLNQGIPYFWTGYPSIEHVLREGETWVCQHVVGRPATNADDPRLKGKPRRIALGYDATANDLTFYGPMTPQQYQSARKALADRFAAETDRLCGSPGHPVFDQFGSATNPQGDLLTENYGVSGWSQSALACMQHTQRNPACPNNTVSPDAPDTSILCLLCFDAQALGPAEQSVNYLPEYIFVSGDMGHPFEMRLSCADAQSGLNNAFGISEMWQMPGGTSQYWYRAAFSVDPTTTGVVTFEAYEELMQLFSAIQLAGPNLTAPHVAGGELGRGPGYVGLYGWQRKFSYDPSRLSPASPAAGFGPADRSFLKGMEEERWDASGSPPGGSEPSDCFGGGVGAPKVVLGCFRIINNAQRFSEPGDESHGLDAWSSARYDETQGSASTPTPPCTGDEQGVLSTGTTWS